MLLFKFNINIKQYQICENLFKNNLILYFIIYIYILIYNKLKNYSLKYKKILKTNS